MNIKFFTILVFNIIQLSKKITLPICYTFYLVSYANISYLISWNLSQPLFSMVVSVMLIKCLWNQYLQHREARKLMLGIIGKQHIIKQESLNSSNLKENIWKGNELSFYFYQFNSPWVLKQYLSPVLAEAHPNSLHHILEKSAFASRT